MGCPPTIRAALVAAAAFFACLVPASVGAAPVSSAHLATLLGPGFSADTINAGDSAPDGQHILFRVRGSHAGGGTTVPTNDVYVVRADGTQLTRLTDSSLSTSGLPITFALGTWWSDSATFWITRFDAAQHMLGGVMSTRTLAVDGGKESWPETVVNPSGGLDRSQLTADGRYLVWSTKYPASTPFTTYFALDTTTRVQSTILGYGGNAAFAPGGVAPGCPASLAESATDDFGHGAFEPVVAALTGPDPACKLGPLATPAPTPVPLAEPLPPGPALRLASVVKSLGQARGRGLALKYEAGEAQQLRVWVLLKKKVGRLKPGATLARASVAKPTAKKPAVLRLRLSAPARKALQGRNRVVVTVRLIATDAAGRRTRVERDVTLDR